MTTKKKWFCALGLIWLTFILLGFGGRHYLVNRQLDKIDATWTAAELASVTDSSPVEMVTVFNLPSRYDRFKRLQNFKITDQQVREKIYPFFAKSYNFSLQVGLVFLMIISLLFPFCLPKKSAEVSLVEQQVS